MPTKYFGWKTYIYGKPLWEILFNLKNFGVGRLVIRNSYLKWEEPSYYRIIRVEPHTIQYPPGRMLGDLWVERVFRGKKYDEPINIGQLEAAFPDFSLIHKHEEDKYKNSSLVYISPKVLPLSGSFPPLWRLLLAREKGLNIMNEDEMNGFNPPLPMVYSFNDKMCARVENENDKANVVIQPQNTSPKQPHLYKHVIYRREDAKAVFDKINESRKFNVQRN